MRGRPGHYLSSILKEQRSHYDTRTSPARRRRCPCKIAPALMACLPIVASLIGWHCPSHTHPSPKRGQGQLAFTYMPPACCQQTVPARSHFQEALYRHNIESIKYHPNLEKEFMRKKAAILPLCLYVILIFQDGFLECLSSNYLLLVPQGHFPLISFSLFIKIYC